MMLSNEAAEWESYFCVSKLFEQRDVTAWALRARRNGDAIDVPAGIAIASRQASASVRIPRAPIGEFGIGIAWELLCIEEARESTRPDPPPAARVAPHSPPFRPKTTAPATAATGQA